jgi:1,2-dihydroxy-3-keto-5-methylthiopentene dioxygenase
MIYWLAKIETPSDAWIRLAVAPGDLLVVPSGIYHRFTLDEEDNLRALRLFQVSRKEFRICNSPHSTWDKDEPKWVPHTRGVETENNPHRIQYLQSIQVGA